MSETINFTRLTTSDKLQDRFLTCQFYQPVDPEQRESGVIFSQIEILTPWFPNSQIGQTVINTLIREYYRGVDTSELVNFENAVKAVNKVLAQIAQNGETDWIGKLSGVLALVNGREIHIAQTGQSHAYLYRGSKLNHITEGLDTADPPHPLKTFNNLTSGTLQTGDKIVVGNSSFFETIAPSELKILAVSFRPAVTALECAKILKSNSNQFANAIFVEITTKESLSNIPPEQKVETVYLDRSAINVGIAARNFLHSKLLPTISALGRGAVLAAKKIGSILARLMKSAKVSAANAAKKRESATTGSIAPHSENSTVRTEDKPSVSEPAFEAVSSNRKSFFNKTSFLKLKNKLRRSLIDIGFYSRNKSKMILAILAVVVLVLAATLTVSLIKRGRGAKNNDQQAKFTSLLTLDSDATVASTRGDQAAALAKYKQILQITADLQNSKFKDEVKSFQDKSNSKILELTKMSTLSPEKTLNADDHIAALSTIGGSLIEILESGEVKQKKTSDDLFAPLFKTTLENSKIVSLSPANDTDEIALVFENKKLAVLDLTAKQATLQPIALKYAGHIKSFNDNLYLLDPVTNEILKIVKEDRSYKSATNYLKDTNVSLASAVDLAVDGSVYVLSSDGIVTQLSRGTKIANFTVSLPVGEKITGWQNIFTSDKSTSMFIVASDASGLRLGEVKKNGTFVGQYQLKDLNSPEKIEIDSTNRVIYALKEQKISVYRF